MTLLRDILLVFNLLNRALAALASLLGPCGRAEIAAAVEGFVRGVFHEIKISPSFSSRLRASPKPHLSFSPSLCCPFDHRTCAGGLRPPSAWSAQLRALPCLENPLSEFALTSSCSPCPWFGVWLTVARFPLTPASSGGSIYGTAVRGHRRRPSPLSLSLASNLSRPSRIQRPSVANTLSVATIAKETLSFSQMEPAVP